MLKRTTVLALVALVFVTVSPVWGRGASATTTASSGVRDLRGLHVVIGSWTTEYNILTATPPTSELGLRTYDWRLQAFREHNFTLEERRVAATADEMFALMVSSIMAGDPAASVFYALPAQTMTLMGQGLLFPISDVTSVNLRNPQPVRDGVRAVEWNQTSLDAFMLNGKSYAFSVGAATSNVDVVFFNKRHFIEAGIDPDLPYNMQRDGTWTWDNFLDLCRRLTRDTNGDGVVDRYAFPRFNTGVILNAFVTSNGAQIVDRDTRTGRFVNTSNSPAFIETLSFLQRMEAAGVMQPRPADVAWDWDRTTFREGQHSMIINQTYFWSTFRDMADDWGMVLPPRGPRSSTVRVATRDAPVMVPSTYNLDRANDIMFAMALYSTPMSEADAWRVGSYPQFRDFRVVDETLDMIRNRPELALYKYSTLIADLPLGEIESRMWDQNVNPATVIETVSSRMNAAIEAFNVSLFGR